VFDPKDFLAKVGVGKTVVEFQKNQKVFSQGDAADTVFYIQDGKVKLTVTSEQGKEAVGEFQKILDHAGVVGNEPIGALAHLGLGRAYVLAGDNAKAKTAYEDFLALWKDADPDIPILQQAKAEYSQLQTHLQ